MTVEGRSTPAPTGLTDGQALGRLGLPTAGDLLAVDHSVLRKAAQQLPASQPDNPIRSLPTGPAQAVLDRGKLSGRMVPVAFHPAGGKPGPLPVALTFDDGPWPHTIAQILAIRTQRQAPATFCGVSTRLTGILASPPTSSCSECWPQCDRGDRAVARRWR